jgi:DnaJ like chaperone protein
MIAAVDGFHEAELAYLGEVATLLGFDAAAQARIRRRHLSPAADDPWAVLGVAPDADAAAIRAAYHALVKRYHPDRALAQGVPAEFIRVSELRMADINAAYDRLTGRRP